MMCYNGYNEIGKNLQKKEGKKEGNVLFNKALNTF